MLDQTPQNKMMTAPPEKKEFHFSGADIYHNLTVLAEDIEIATQEWLAKRQFINPPEPSAQSTPAPEPEAEETKLQ